MSQSERISQLLKDVGPIVDRIEAINEDDGGYWVISFQDGLLMSVHADDSEIAMLTTHVGTPNAVDRERVLEELLSLNMHWQETGGVRYALSFAGGDIVQLYGFRIDSLTVSALSQLIEDQAARAIALRAMLQQPRDNSQSGKVSMTNAIRV